MSGKSIEVLFSPAEYAALRARDLSRTVCVVFDILRATTTMITGLANGASAFIPVSKIAEALALRQKDPQLRLAGERGGYRISAQQTGSIDFDFGNSPREFTREKIEGQRIAITTTNGTRALKACAEAAEVHIGSFRNISALIRAVSKTSLENILLICAGTGDEAALEDTLAAGAVCDEFFLNPQSAFRNPHLQDSAQIALSTYLHHKPNLMAAANAARNGRKLLSIPELAPDVAVCFAFDSLKNTARMHKDGVISPE